MSSTRRILFKDSQPPRSQRGFVHLVGCAESSVPFGCRQGKNQVSAGVSGAHGRLCVLVAQGRSGKGYSSVHNHQSLSLAWVAIGKSYFISYHFTLTLVQLSYTTNRLEGLEDVVGSSDLDVGWAVLNKGLGDGVVVNDKHSSLRSSVTQESRSIEQETSSG